MSSIVLPRYINFQPHEWKILIPHLSDSRIEPILLCNPIISRIYNKDIGWITAYWWIAAIAFPSWYSHEQNNNEKIYTLNRICVCCINFKWTTIKMYWFSPSLISKIKLTIPWNSLFDLKPFIMKSGLCMLSFSYHGKRVQCRFTFIEKQHGPMVLYMIMLYKQ